MQVTKRDYADESEWKHWIWKSQEDLMENGAFFVESGDPKHVFPTGKDMIVPKPGTLVSKLTRFAGAIACKENKPC